MAKRKYIMFDVRVVGSDDDKMIHVRNALAGWGDGFRNCLNAAASGSDSCEIGNRLSSGNISPSQPSSASINN